MENFHYNLILLIRIRRFFFITDVICTSALTTLSPTHCPIGASSQAPPGVINVLPDCNPSTSNCFRAILVGNTQFDGGLVQSFHHFFTHTSANHNSPPHYLYGGYFQLCCAFFRFQLTLQHYWFRCGQFQLGRFCARCRGFPWMWVK